MKLTSLLSQTPEHTPLSLILAWRNLVRWQLTEGREDVPGVWRDLETKMRRNYSHVPHPVLHPIEPLEPSSMEPLVNLLAELPWHCDIAAICVTLSSASVVESQLELVFGHVWCDLLSSEARPCKIVLLYSVARKRFNRTFHSKCPCFRPYNRTSGPDKSAMRIPNLQATTTQSPKDLISEGITSCSVQLLLRVVNVQATHMYPLVHAQWHVQDALDSGPQYLMQLHNLMLHSCLRLFNVQLGISSEAAPPFHETPAQGRSISSSSRDSSFVDYAKRNQVLTSSSTNNKSARRRGHLQLQNTIKRRPISAQTGITIIQTCHAECWWASHNSVPNVLSCIDPMALQQLGTITPDLEKTWPFPLAINVVRFWTTCFWSGKSM